MEHTDDCLQHADTRKLPAGITWKASGLSVLLLSTNSHLTGRHNEAHEWKVHFLTTLYLTFYITSLLTYKVVKKYTFHS